MDNQQPELDFRRLLKDHDARKEQAANDYKRESKERLKKIACGKVRTTMIGALDVLEKNFGFLFGLDEEGQDKGEPLSPEEQHMKTVFDEARLKILDLGNDQIRNLSVELEQYDISWNRYQVTLPVKPEGPERNQNEN